VSLRCELPLASHGFGKNPIAAALGRPELDRNRDLGEVFGLAVKKIGSGSATAVALILTSRTTGWRGRSPLMI
jgi:hypothetical protein